MGTEVGSSVATTPGALSTGTLIRSVLDYCQGSDADHLRDVVRRELNFAIDEVNSFGWRRLITAQDIVLTSGDAEYELDDTMKEPTRAVLYQGTTRKLRLEYLPHMTFLERFYDRSNQVSPGSYTIDYVNRVLILEGTPNTEFVTNYDTLRLHYYRRLVYLVGDSDAHGGQPEFNAFLVWRARSGFAAIRGEQQLSVRAEAKANKLFRDLRVDDAMAATDWK